MPKIKLDQNKCIGCHSCVILAPADYEISTNGKATLLHAQQNGAILEKELTHDDVVLHQHIADSCPMDGIKIIDNK